MRRAFDKKLYPVFFVGFCVLRTSGCEYILSYRASCTSFARAKVRGYFAAKRDAAFKLEPMFPSV